MGVDLIATGGHSWNFQKAEEVIDSIQNRLPINLADQYTSPYFQSETLTKQEWKLEPEPYFHNLEEEWKRNTELTFTHSIGYSLYLSQKAFSIYTRIRFKAFILNKHLQKETRENVFKIVQSLNGREIIYCPDSGSDIMGIEGYITWGKPYEEMKEKVKNEYGEPFDLFAIDEDLEKFPDYYFIDEFNDLI